MMHAPVLTRELLPPSLAASLNQQLWLWLCPAGWWRSAAASMQTGFALALSCVAHRFIQRAVRAFGWIGEHAVDYQLRFREERSIGGVAIIYRLSHLRLISSHPEGVLSGCSVRSITSRTLSGC